MAIQQPRTKSGGAAVGGSGSVDSGEKARNVWLETVAELKKTTWPTQKEAIHLTSVVIGIIVALGIYMGTLDSILSFLVTRYQLIK